MKSVNRIRMILSFILQQMKLFLSFVVHRRKITSLSKNSLLSDGNRRKLLYSNCPVCGSSDFRNFIALPFGYPEGQTHALMYFDFCSPYFKEASRREKTLNKLLGFYLNTYWNFWMKP